MLLDYARPSGVKICIENHGCVSNDPDWMVSLAKRVDDPLFGTYPDWRGPSDDFDHINILEKTVPYAVGQSVAINPPKKSPQE